MLKMVRHHVDAKLRQGIRRAGFRRQVAVAVLRHRDARAGDDEGRGGRYVERALAVAAGADDVHCPFRRAHGIALRQHDPRGGGDFLDRFAAGPERHEEAAHLGGRRGPLEQRLERALGLCPIQGPFRRKPDERAQVVAHAGALSGTWASSRKVRSSRWPCSEAID